MQFYISDYFFGPPSTQPVTEDIIVIERNRHICTEPYFVDNFKMLYQGSDPLLLEHPCLDQFEEEDYARIVVFSSDVCLPLKTETITKALQDQHKATNHDIYSQLQ